MSRYVHRAPLARPTVVFSTLALVVGFGALCMSDFVPIIYFGVLVSLPIAVVGLACLLAVEGIFKAALYRYVSAQEVSPPNV